MAAARRISSTHESVLSKILESRFQKTEEDYKRYFKYYFVTIDSDDDNLITYKDSRLDLLKRFLDDSINTGALMFMLRSLEKNRIIIENEKFDRDISRVLTKTCLDFRASTLLSPFNHMLFDRFYSLLYRKTDLNYHLSTHEEVLYVMLINTLETNGFLRISDSSEETVDTNMFKFS